LEEEKLELFKQVRELSTELDVIKAEGLPASMIAAKVASPTAPSSVDEVIFVFTIPPVTSSTPISD